MHYSFVRSDLHCIDGHARDLLMAVVDFHFSACFVKE
jgi:hypothetical protein